MAENQSKYDAEITSKTRLLEESDLKQEELQKQLTERQTSIDNLEREKHTFVLNIDQLQQKLNELGVENGKLQQQIKDTNQAREEAEKARDEALSKPQN